MDGGSGAGVTINPVAFLVINKETIKLMPINHTSTFDRIADYVPDILSKFCKKENCKEDEKEDEKKDNVIDTTIKTEIIKEKDDNYLEDE